VWLSPFCCFLSPPWGGRRLWRGREKEKSSPPWISLSAAASVLAVLTGIFGAARVHQLESRTDAIVTAREATVRSATDMEKTAVFVIHEGTKVLVERREGTCLLIRLASGPGGWILAEEATVI